MFKTLLITGNVSSRRRRSVACVGTKLLSMCTRKEPGKTLVVEQ